MTRPERKDIRSLDGVWTERFSASHSKESEDRRARGRFLRRQMTMPEKILWSKLRRDALGVHFRRQHPLGPFTVDFYCHEAWLVVEVDGRFTHEYHEEEDRARDAYLRGHGVEVVRFTASAVTKDVWQVVGAIRDAIARRLAPSPKGEVPAASRAEGATGSTASRRPRRAGARGNGEAL
jgi:very-short-patch-repair endonuclease